MIKIICGEKGTGKTKIITDLVNDVVKEAKGNVVFISEKKSYSANIDFNVRCVFTEDYAVSNISAFVGFIDGLMAGNSDIEYIFADGIMRIADCGVNDMVALFEEAEKLEKEYGVKFVFTVSCAKENLPEYMAKFAN